MERKILQYLPYSSAINPSFWHKFTEIKLDTDRLNDDGKNVTGSYTNCNSLGNFLDVDCMSFDENFSAQPYIFPAHGIIFNKNTIEDFKNCDKSDLLKNCGDLLWKNMTNGNCLKDPSLLMSFIILSFADLKSYKYYYWFAFPAPSVPLTHLESTSKISEVFTRDQIQDINDVYLKLPYKHQTNFIIYEDGFNFHPVTLEEAITIGSNDNLKEFLEKYKNIFFCFSDASNNDNPSWSLRNYIALIMFHCPVLHGKTIRALSIRVNHDRTINNSLVFDIILPSSEKCSGDVTDVQTWLGWERNENGKLGPRLANIGNSMNPTKLAESSVDLNLKLMKWRLLPELDLDKIKNLKCLLLGAGTLGCAVARCLLGWGVRTITFVDSGKVSYSNPVRQNLFINTDCLNGGKFKAEAASERLQEIFPGVNSKGYILRIPMPGHTIGESLLDEMKNNLSELKRLIDEHDCIFLLTDSRESRWLPTLLSASTSKIVITAALGFDSYLVLRHGIKKNNEEIDIATSTQSMEHGIKSIRGDMLGCYFCNDVTAPGNSLQDRTLDQQCTVTRPGVSNIAASLAVELVISISQHPLRSLAEAYYSVEVNKNGMQKVIPSESILGVIPHSIRGYLGSYEHITPAVERFTQCIACSEHVLNAYSEQGDEFLLKVFESAQYLEKITGLTEMLQSLDHSEMWALSDTDDET